MIRRFLVIFLFLSAPAFAAVPPSIGWFFDNWKTGRQMGPYGDVAAACSAMVALNNDASAGISSSLLESTQLSSNSGQCKWQNYANGQKLGDPAYGSVRGKLSCPGDVAPDATGMCPDPPDQCKSKAGTSEIVNITSGWSRDAGPTTPAQSWVYTYKLPAAGVANFCSSDGCQQSIDVTEPCAECQAYTSQVPGTNGLYRKSVDFRAHYSGTACDPSKSDIDRDLTSANDQRDPPCPGYVGEVNGVKGCYGTADKPVRPTEPQMPNKPQDNGNPAAGPKPSSGEGSGTGGTGRTPSTGTGGSAGGPAGAAAGGTGSGGTGSGTRPDGTTNKPSEGKEQQACGAPGQPKCAIDESGMPDGKSAFDGSKGDLDKADRDRTDMLSRIKDTGDKNTSWGQSFSWVQHGGCEPWDLGVLPLGVDIPIKVNICPIMPYIEWVTSFLWAITTFALTIGMVFRVTSSSGS